MEWPWQYNFPPFFTLQPNEDTKNKQIDAWCDLILKYGREKRIFQLDLVEACCKPRGSSPVLLDLREAARLCRFAGPDGGDRA